MFKYFTEQLVIISLLLSNLNFFEEMFHEMVNNSFLGQNSFHIQFYKMILFEAFGHKYIKDRHWWKHFCFYWDSNKCRKE